MKKSGIASLAAISLVFWVSSAWAALGVAEISAVQGKVLVNQGDGFETVTGSMTLKPGDRVLVGEESSAQIGYLRSDCLISAGASSLLTISEAAPCGAGKVVGAVDSYFIHAARADENDDDDDKRWSLFLFGGASIAAIILAVHILDDDDDDDDDDDGGPVSRP